MITKENVKKIANLARIKVSEAEEEKLQKDLSSILEYIDTLSEVDVSDVRPTAHAADIFNIKLAKSGLSESIRMAEYLRKMKKKLMIGCMMESAIGIAASVHWACGSGWFDFIDLDSFLILKPLPIQSGFKNNGSSIWLDSPSAGSGTEISLKKLDPWFEKCS